MSYVPFRPTNRIVINRNRSGQLPINFTTLCCCCFACLLLCSDWVEVCLVVVLWGIQYHQSSMSILGIKCNTMEHPNGNYPEPVSALSAESRILIFKLKKPTALDSLDLKQPSFKQVSAFWKLKYRKCSGF